MNWEKDLIDYRREKAAETLENARVSLEKKHLFSAVNRVYYALFYEISALLKTKNLSSPKHSGIRALLVPCETVIGFVYVDENQNGACDEGEVRTEGVLLKAKDKEVITGKDGQFIFRNLPTLWKQWIEVKKEQLYYKGSVENLRFNIDSKE